MSVPGAFCGPTAVIPVASHCGSSAVVALAPVTVAWLDYGQASGVLWKDQLFVGISGLLYRGPFSPGAKRVRAPMEYINFPVFDESGSQAKVHIRDDRLLTHTHNSGYHIFPMQELSLLEASEFGDKLRKLRLGPDDFAKTKDPFHLASQEFGRYSQIVISYHAEYHSLLFPEHRPHDVPVAGDGDDGMYWRTARHDVLIHGPKSVWLFHAYKDKFFLSVEPDYLVNWYLNEKGDDVAKNLPKPPERQLRTGKLPADFTESFAAYAAGDRHYLVTPNGKAYMVAPKGKAEVEVSAVWNDPKWKIVGVVQDQENDSVYGWGIVTTRTAPERFYVKLGPKPVAVPYKLTVPLWDDRSDAYLESYECARAFRNAAEKK